MKSINLKKAVNQSIKVCTWYDTVSPESSEHGDYEQTGCDWHESLCDDLYETAKEIASWLDDHYVDHYIDLSVDVLYAIDGDTDYASGEVSYDRLCVMAEPRLTDLQRRSLNMAVDRLLR